MPIHDWSKVDANVFHHFHQRWAIAIADHLNAGKLPKGYSALVEQHAAGLTPDVLAIERGISSFKRPGGGLTVMERPKTRMIVETKEDALVRKASRIAIRHRMGEVVCVIEIVSPGNKNAAAAIRSFVEKTVGFIQRGVNVVVIDLFPPGPRDPQGIHKRIWDEIEDAPFEPPPGEPLMLASYLAAHGEQGPIAFLEPTAVGARMPDVAAYLQPENFVFVPLEPTYETAWNTCPEDMRYLVEHGKLPGE